jgi:hypothetical protein
LAVRKTTSIAFFDVFGIAGFTLSATARGVLQNRSYSALSPTAVIASSPGFPFVPLAVDLCIRSRTKLVIARLNFGCTALALLPTILRLSYDSPIAVLHSSSTGVAASTENGPIAHLAIHNCVTSHNRTAGGLLLAQ